MLVYPSSIYLSSRTLSYLSAQLHARRREVGTRWRRLPTDRQALLALAHLRCGDTYAQLAGMDAQTAWVAARLTRHPDEYAYALAHPGSYAHALAHLDDRRT